MEISEFIYKLEKNSKCDMDSNMKKTYWDCYKILPTKEKVFNCDILKGNDYHTANHLFEWNIISKIIEPIYSNNGIFIGQNIYFYK